GIASLDLFRICRHLHNGLTSAYMSMKVLEYYLSREAMDVIRQRGEALALLHSLQRRRSSMSSARSSTDHPMCKELALPPEREIDVNTRFHRAVRCLKAAYVRLGPEMAKRMKGHPSEHKLRMLKLLPTLKLEKESSRKRR
ncbi:hypothetical protein PRIPAC_95548, partial [Pristionchus pacificus]